LNEIAPAAWKARNARGTSVLIAAEALLAPAAIVEADSHEEVEEAFAVVEAAGAEVSGSRSGRLPVGIILGRLPSRARTGRYFEKGFKCKQTSHVCWSCQFLSFISSFKVARRIFPAPTLRF